jgi:hypothetical protein
MTLLDQTLKRFADIVASLELETLSVTAKNGHDVIEQFSGSM